MSQTQKSVIYSRVMRVNATLKTMTTTTDNIGGIRQDLYSLVSKGQCIILRIEEANFAFCRQITADDVAVLQLQLVGGTFVMVTINSQVLFEQKLSSYSAGEPFFHSQQPID